MSEFEEMVSEFKTLSEYKDCLESQYNLGYDNTNPFPSFLVDKIENIVANKVYNVMNNIGKAKYVVSFHDGIKTHKDGSRFSDIRIFSNKKKMNSFIKELNSEEYSEK